MSYNKYPYLDINEEELLNGIKQIQKICNTINDVNNSYLHCTDCPFDHLCCEGDISNLHINNDEELDTIVNSLVALDKKIKNDKMTF